MISLVELAESQVSWLFPRPGSLQRLLLAPSSAKYPALFIRRELRLVPIRIAYVVGKNRATWKISNQWIGLRENLQETMVFTIKLVVVSCKFSHHPVL
jgi:hypothetical protein